MKLLLSLGLISTPFLLSTSSHSSAQSVDEGSYHHPLSHENRPACGTYLMWQILASEATLDKKGQELLDLKQLAQRPTLGQSIVSSQNHFRIHFDVDGINAPPLTDFDANGVPDYIDSVNFYMEEAWKIEVEVCGYATPPPDN